MIFMFSGYLRSYAGDAILIVYKRGERRNYFNKYLNTHRKIVFVFIIFYVLIVYGLFDLKMRSNQYFMSKILVL